MQRYQSINVGMKNFHDFKVETIDGQIVSLDTFKGYKLLVVNVASECGLTPQYETLQEMYNNFKDKNFSILAFPANNFGAQEPGTNSEIQTFCTINYGVTFPVMAKISVAGQDMHEIYQWLTQKSQNQKEDSTVEWNFQKYLIDENGNYAGMHSPSTSPADESIMEWIENG